MSCLIEQYLKERRDFRIWRSGDYAFLTWKPTDDNGAYIQDIYVIPEYRRQSEASCMTDSFVKWLRVNMPSCERLYGSVDFTAKNPELGLIAMLLYGFKIKNVMGNGLWLCKELE